jgi:hypothetical protein
MRLKKHPIRSKKLSKSFTAADLSLAKESAETLVGIFEKNKKYVSEQGDSSDYRNKYSYNLISSTTQSIVTLAMIAVSVPDLPLEERCALLEFCVKNLTDIQKIALNYCQKYEGNYKTGNMAHGLAEVTDALLKTRLCHRHLESFSMSAG